VAARGAGAAAVAVIETAVALESLGGVEREPSIEEGVESAAPEEVPEPERPLRPEHEPRPQLGRSRSASTNIAIVTTNNGMMFSTPTTVTHLNLRDGKKSPKNTQTTIQTVVRRKCFVYV
jgi:hypothetical protein